MLVIGVAGHELTAQERDWLQHEGCAGVILFTRNYVSPEQLKALTTEVHALRTPSLLIAIDHEGGRVQRFRSDGFTRLPAMRSLGALWERDHLAALDKEYDRVIAENRQAIEDVEDLVADVEQALG